MRRLGCRPRVGLLTMLRERAEEVREFLLRVVGGAWNISRVEPEQPLTASRSATAFLQDFR